MKRRENKEREIKGVHRKNAIYVINTSDVIGEGGAGKVFTGYIKNTDPLVKLAIKKIPEDVIRKMRKDYERLVFQKLLEVPHRHLCYTYDIIEHRRHECRYIVMELVEGGNLSSFVKKKNGLLAMKTVRRFFKQIVYGLEALKRERIIHRDLKPENILLTEKDEETCILKICDFGTSKVIISGSEDLTETRGCMGIGTPGYSAPELYLDHTGASYDRRVDLWSVGCLLHFLCFGVRPFKVGGRNYRALWGKVFKGLHFDDEEVKKRQICQEALNLMLALCRYDKDAKPPWKYRMTYDEFMKDPFVLSCLDEGRKESEKILSLSSSLPPPSIPKRNYKQPTNNNNSDSKFHKFYSKEEYGMDVPNKESYRLFFQDDDEMRKLASGTKSLIFRDCKRSISIGSFGYFLEFEKKDYPSSLVLYVRAISLLSRHTIVKKSNSNNTRKMERRTRRVRRGSVIRIPLKYEGWVSARLEELKERADEVSRKIHIHHHKDLQVGYFESLVLKTIQERMKDVLRRIYYSSTEISPHDLALMKYSSCILTYISRYKKWKKHDIFLINNYIHAFERVIYLAGVEEDEEEEEEEGEEVE